MKNCKNRIFVAVLFSFLLILLFGITCQAETISQNSKLTVEGGMDGNTACMKVHLSEPGIVKLKAEITLSKEKITVLEQFFSVTLEQVLFDEEFTKENYDKLEFDGLTIEEIEEDIILGETAADLETGNVYCKSKGNKIHVDSTTDMLPAGDYILYFFNSTGYDWKVNYSLAYYTEYAKGYTLPSSITFKAGSNYKLNLVEQPANSLAELDEFLPSSKTIKLLDAGSDYVLFTAEKPGTYTLALKPSHGQSSSVKIIVTENHIPKLKYGDTNIYVGGSFRNSVLYSSKKVIWSSSNTKVATVNQKGKIVAKKPGVCKITAKVGKKKLICKINVLATPPDFYAVLTSYNRTGNYFKVRIKNNGNKPLKIYASGLEAIHCDYNSLCRKLSLSNNKSITLKPHQKKTLTLYVNGTRTSDQYENYSILFKVRYDGKPYYCCTDAISSKYKGSDKNTFINGYEYYQWCGFLD